ncbi:MAG: hypothetical protein CMJ75_18950 [Planctomycetaceae bacterium]|nr:hypothetical protein [Planctomycetaceae bacterium]
MNRKYFDDLLKDRQISLRTLAGKLELLPSQLSLTFSDKRRMQLGEAVLIGQLLGVPLAEVAFNAGIDVARRTMRRTKVTGFMKGDGTVLVAPPRERTTMPPGLPYDTTAIEVRAAKSAFGWMDRWMLFVGPPRDPRHLIDRFCVVTLEDGRKVIATLMRTRAKNKYELCGPFNAKSVPVVDAAPIISIRN